MKKILDWEILFHEYLYEIRNKPFEWGKWDCCIASNEILKKITGENLLPKSWKNWKTEEEAFKAIDKLSKGKGLAVAIENAMKKKKGWSSIKPNFVTKGDLVVFKNIDGDGTSVCAVHDGFGVIGISDEGLEIKQNVEITHAWRLSV